MAGTLQENTIRLGDNTFSVHRAFFKRVAGLPDGDGWDFKIESRFVSGDEALYRCGAAIEAEASPIPLHKADDYTGVDLVLPGEYDDASGEPYFCLRLVEWHGIADARIQFLAREGERYLVRFNGMVDRTVVGHPILVDALAWVELLEENESPAEAG